MENSEEEGNSYLGLATIQNENLLQQWFFLWYIMKECRKLLPQRL